MSKIILTTGGTASTPTTGTVALYSKTDKKIYFKDDTGTEAEVSTLSTPADILAAIITVDGAASGLDADLLDGLDSTAFATAAQGTLADSALQNIIEDTTPQLGGNLDNNGFNITDIGNTVLGFSSDGEGATNWINVAAALTSTGPTISAVGLDTNIDLVLQSKGTGSISANTSKIINVLDPILAQDAATKNYVDTEISTVDAGNLDNIVEDVTPQLGGQLDVNTFGLGDGTNLLLSFVEDASAVNWIEIENEATGSGPIIRSVGADTDIDLHITAKGAGIITLGSGGVKLNAPLDTNGNNITMTGAETVDGRDLSVDGTKLDGIEASATADQTAGEILTALLTVDGTGTGLDADLLDGLDSTAFADFAQGILADNALQNIIEDTTPQLGGNLDVNGKQITSVSNGNVVIQPDGTGEIEIGFVLYSKRIQQTIVDNTTAVFLTYPASPQSAMFVDYLLVRTASNVRTGTLVIANNASTATVVDTGADVGSVAVTFSVAINVGNVEVSYIAASTGSAGAMRYQTRRIEDT